MKNSRKVLLAMLAIAGVTVLLSVAAFTFLGKQVAESVNSPYVTEVTDATFAKEVFEAGGPVLVVFEAENCDPCDKFAPIVARVADSYQGKVKVVKLDVGQNPVTAMSLGIRTVPSILFVKPGASQGQYLIGGVEGLLSRGQLEQFLDLALDPNAPLIPVQLQQLQSGQSGELPIIEGGHTEGGQDEMMK